MLAICLCPGLALAGHGDEFLIVDSPGGPDAGEFWLLTPASYSLDRRADTVASFEPALTIGGARTSLQVQAHGSRQRGMGWHNDGTSVAGQYVLTDPNAAGGLQAGITLEHDFVNGGADASGIAFGVQGGNERDTWAADVSATRSEGRDELEGAFGYRHSVRDDLALSMEMTGSLQRADGMETLLAAHVDTSPRWALKAGLGAIRDDGRTAAVARIELLVRLHAPGSR